MFLPYGCSPHRFLRKLADTLQNPLLGLKTPLPPKPPVPVPPPADTQHLGDGHGRVTLEALVERLALEERHNDEGHAVVLGHMEDRHDMVVFDGGGGAPFTEEAIPRRLAAG